MVIERYRGRGNDVFNAVKDKGDYCRKTKILSSNYNEYESICSYPTLALVQRAAYGLVSKRRDMIYINSSR